MKINKNIFICALLVLMIFLCINACSAEETLNETLGVDSIDELAIYDTPVNELSVNEDTIGVNTNGDFRTISDTVSIATGEETGMLPQGTIYVSETGNDENNGSSEDDAIATLSHAVDIVKARENKTATVYMLNGDYTTTAIDIGDDEAVSLSIIGQEEGGVTIQGTGNYIFDIYGDNLVWNFKNLDFVALDSTARTSAALVLYSKNGNFTVDNCNFRNIKSKLGAIAIGNDNGNTNVANCNIENVIGSASSTSILTVNGDGTFILDNIKIKDCRLDEDIASSNAASYLRTIIYVNTYEADVTISNSEIINNNGPAMSLIECRSKLTIVNSTISDNVVNTSPSGSNGGDNLIWANNDNSDINIVQSKITNNTIVKSGKGLFYNQKGSINVEYCDVSNNEVDSFVGASGTITANNNWWGTNDQPDAKVDNWVIMNVEVDDSDLSENNKVTFTIDFNHVKTSSGTVEELTGGEIPKDSYSIYVSAQNGTVTPTNVVVQKGEVKSETFTVTNVNDVITLTCDGAVVEVTVEGGVEPSSYGIIYLNKTGDDSNDGSIDAPVATLTKAIELANKGLGQIIIDEGTYIGYGYQVTNDLNITGVGKVTLDANGEGGLFATGYPTNASKFLLTNLTLAGANADFGQAINSYAGELILNNVNITDNIGSGSLIIQSGKLTINNCIIANHNGGNVISDSSSAQIVINNTIFANNTVTDYAICYFSGYSGDLIIENTQFINNTGKLGIVKTNKKINVKDSKFIDNTNTNSYGGAICDCDSFTITNSTFVNNKAARDGGAVSVGYNRVATITKSTFINNMANTENGAFHGDAIYNYGKLTVNYCVLLTNSENALIYSESEYDANAQYNWWGTNDNPSSLNGVGTYEDDWYDEVDCVIDSSNWVYMNVTTDLTENNVNIGDNVEITVDFTNYVDSSNVLNPLSESIPEVEVSADAIKGNLDAYQQTTIGNIARFTYTAVNDGEDTITVTSANVTVPIAINVNGQEKEIIYVDGTNGADTNDGKTRENAVKTIEHAVEIADGKIVILEGQYTVTSILNITKDLDIAGEGDVTVKSNVAQTITYEEWDDWDEEWVTRTKTIYNLIENNANLNLSNIKFTLVPASINMEMITNNANLFINACEFNNIKVTSSKGVIQNIKTANLEVNGTTFSASTSTYGAINSNGLLLVNNSRFVDADRSGQSGVYSTAITVYNNATITNTEFINNKGGAGGAVYVMYSYTNKENPNVLINNCTFEENEATSNYGDGAAIKCSGNQVTLTVANSTFNKNTAARYGGAIYAQGTVNIDQCVFTQNSAATANTVYAYGGTIDISNSIILDEGIAIERYESSYSTPATVTANDNWWGTNDQPANVGENITVDTWVKMDASFAPETAQADDEVIVTATFDNGKLPNGVINVTFTSTSGNLNQRVTVENAQASVTYIIDATDVDITATSGNAQVVMPIELPAAGTIYVSKTGNDENDGSSQENAVATIAHAIELANNSIGKIIILAGEYTLADTLSVTKDLDIEGKGEVIINGNQNRFIQNDAALNLTNLQFTNGYSTGSNLIYTSSTGVSLSMDNVKFYNNSAKYGVSAASGTKLIINNSEFYDNDLTLANTNALGVVYSASADTVIENTLFRNNKAQKGGAIYSSRASTATTGSLDIINCTFDSNSALKGTGGAIFVSSNNNVVNISNSKFINNTATKGLSGGDGAAIILTTGSPQMTIVQSVFIDNGAETDTGICLNKGSLNITDSIILSKEGNGNYTINVVDGTLSAENNWWGNNDDANTNADVAKIVKMDAAYTPQEAEVGDEITITVTFDNDNLPKDIIDVTFTSSSGNLNEVVTMDGPQANVTYTLDAADNYIEVSSSKANVFLPFDADAGKIFVLPGASDSNPGTRDAPVGTIAHALEIATKGKIVLLEGTHKTDELDIISDDLTITGEGRVVIDAQNNNRIFSVGEDANVLIENVIMVNGYTAEYSGALIINGNKLTLINCTLANSSAGTNNAGAVFNAGDLIIINTTFANNSAREGGAIFTQISEESHSISIINSTFENNVATGNDALGGGAIYVQRNNVFYNVDLTINNSTFVNNRAETDSCGGAIALVQLDATVKITDSKFISNHANAQDKFGGGAIYTVGVSNYEKLGTMIITGTLFENNTCGANGGAIYARATTVNIAGSALINNTDANGLAIYGYKTDTVAPTITLNDNWWGSNDSPKNLVGGNNNYKPTLNRWAILTVTNDTAIVEGNTVKLTVSINNYTTGTQNGTLSNPITVARDVTITTTFDNIKGVLENGEFTYDLTVPANLKYLSASVDNETVVLFVVASDTIVELEDIAAKKYEVVNVSINLTTTEGANVDCGNVELYAGDSLIAIIPVSNGKAEKEVTFGLDEGTYELIAAFSDNSGLYTGSESNATLTVSGIIELTNETFFNFFDETGILKEAINEAELVFHGEFGGLGVNVITINRPMVISGDEAVLYDMAYKLISDDITLTDVSLISQAADFTSNYGAAIYASGAAIVIDNVSVEYNAPSDKEAFAIFARTADEFMLINSEIKYTGNNHDYSRIIHQFGIHVAESNDVLIANNVIIGSLPALDVAYNYMYPELIGIYQDLVAIIAIQDGTNVDITENTINVSTDGGYGLYPTISSVLVNGVDELLINYNNITHIDLTSEDVARYYYTVDLYSSNLAIEFNNILLNTTSGINRYGSAYPIQLTGPINALINKNNLTSISKGPNLGIFSADWDGDVVVTITDNLINITGYSTENNTALVSGMELQTEFAYVYNNTIYTYNIGKYDDVNSIYGISYAQWYYGDHSFDIRENTIFTEGKYAVFILNGVNSNVTDNILYAHDLYGDESVNIGGGSGNIVIDNYPVAVDLNVSVVNATVLTNATVTVTSNVEGVVSIKVGDVYEADNVTIGEEFILPALPAGVYDVMVEFDGTLYYLASINGSEKLEIVKVTPEIYVVADSIVYGESIIVNITGSVAGDYAVTIDDITKQATVETAGEFVSVDFGALAAGVYEVCVSYLGDENYNNASAEASVRVSKATPTIKVSAEDIKYGEALIVNVELSGDVARRAIVTIGNESKLVSLTNGTGSVKFTGLNAGTYTVTATYNGDSNYDAKAIANTTVTVKKATPTIKVTTRHITAGEDLVVNVKVSDAISRRVIVTIGNESKLVSLTNGTGSVIFSGLTKGTYTVIATYNGDANYDTKASANTTVTVYKGPANIKATAQPVAFGEEVVIDLQLPSEISRRVNVTLGNETKLVKLTNGTASVKFSGLAVGTYNAIVTYNGDENYTKTSVNVTAKVVKATPDIQITTGDISVGEALTVDVQLPADVSRRATVTVGNESKTVSLKEGAGSVKFTGLEAGTYDVVVSYNGDSNFNPSSNSTSIEVKE